jgi:hypothetical protein
MAKRWEELGNNRWKLTITSDDPGENVPPSVFRGTKEEIADLLAESQGHANRRIAELRRSTPAAPAPPKELSAAERLQTVAELNDPATVDKAITRVMSVEQDRERRQRDGAARFEADAVQAATSFAEETPEWYPSEFNKNTLVRYMQSQGMNPTVRAHYTQAFEELDTAKLLQPRPPDQQDTESEDNDDERNAPAPQAPRTPTRISTGVTQRDISGLPPKPTTRLKYSREQLADMSREQYKRLMLSDGKELQRCEDYYSRHPASKAG